MLSYNYTLDHQGFTNNISCVYDPQSPIRLWTVPDNPLKVASNASCDGIGLENFSKSVPDSFVAPNTDNTLMMWACKSKPTGEGDVAYYIYLRGPVYDASGHGNITCTVTPRPSIFPVTYQSSTGVFLTQERITTSNPTTAFFKLVENAILGLPEYLSAQTTGSNLVANSVWNLGIQSLGLTPYGGQEDDYLPLYAAMIQGILVNEVCPASNSLLLSLMGVPQITYIRFLYSAHESPPPSCIRTVNGTLSAEVIGWVAKPVHIAFLMPMTMLNLASFVVVLIAMSRAKRGCYEFDPTDPRPLVLAEPSIAEGEPSGWADGVSYRPREVCECYTIPVRH